MYLAVTLIEIQRQTGSRKKWDSPGMGCEERGFSGELKEYVQQFRKREIQEEQPKKKAESSIEIDAVCCAKLMLLMALSTSPMPPSPLHELESCSTESDERNHIPLVVFFLWSLLDHACARNSVLLVSCRT